MTIHADTQPDPVALIAALVSGDRWLSADACAAYLGGITRRHFLENIACQPTFPTALTLGHKTKAWKKSEVEQWADNYRRSAKRAN